MFRARFAFVAVAVCSAAACVDGEGEGEDGVDVSVPFAAVVGDDAFACDASYAGVGSGGAAFDPIDARFYVHGVTLLAGVEERPVTLDSNDFQHEGTALLDFEDDSGSCETGSPRTHTALTGRVSSLDGVDGLRFTIGVPLAQNHLNAATAPAPLNEPGMFWAWASGFKHVKVEGKTAVKDVVYFHVGAQTCSGDEGSGFSCAAENTADIALDYEDGDEVVFDVGAVYAGIDLDADLAAGDVLDGCMSFDGDPQCAPMFGALGLSYEGAVAPAQAAFSVRAR